MEIGRRNRTRYSYFDRGVALLMSMSVVLLLSIALMKTFEKRSLEVAQLGHNLDRFQAENLSRSGLKLILFSIKRSGLVTVNAYLDQLKQIDFPVGNGFMKIIEISPVDHRFNVNKKISKADEPRVAVFRNIINQIKSSKNEYNYLSAENVFEALGAIIDWTDPNEHEETVFHSGSESYPHEEPEFNVKNKEFDRLSEVRLLPAFRSLGIAGKDVEKNFRATDGKESVEFIDVNLTPIEDIERFLDRYDGVVGFTNLYSNRDEIVDLIENTRSATPAAGITGFSPVVPSFPVDKFGITWSDKLTSVGISNLEPEEKDLFKPTTNHLFIHYKVSVGRVTLNARSLVRVKYVENKFDINKIIILWLRVS